MPADNTREPELSGRSYDAASDDRLAELAAELRAAALLRHNQNIAAILIEAADVLRGLQKQQ